MISKVLSAFPRAFTVRTLRCIAVCILDGWVDMWIILSSLNWHNPHKMDKYLQNCLQRNCRWKIILIKRGVSPQQNSRVQHLPPSKNSNNHFRFVHSLPLLWSPITDGKEMYFYTIKFANLKIKGLSKWEATSIYLRSIRIAIWDTLIQAEVQIVFRLGDKSNEYLWEREGEQVHQ